KPTQWLIYWYVCGTDIETTRIAFGTGTNLMSDDPKALILAEPDREPGDATRCINEVEKANLSPDVKIFMQAGGTYIWGHEKFRDLNAKIQTAIGYGEDKETSIEYPIYFQKSNKVRIGKWFLAGGGGNTVAKPVEVGKIGRYVYDKDHRNWHAREQLPIITGTKSLDNGTTVTVPMKNTATDMGSKEGLIDFLQAGQKIERELYPDGNVRRVLIMKNHGGSTLSGICFDEYTKNQISLPELRDAFAEVKEGWTNPDEKPFEVVAFDACIMSNYETALTLENTANYMVASQETTFGKVALNYTELLNELSKNPSMSGKELGKVICDTRWKDAKNVGKEFSTDANALFTLSVVDLSENKMTALKTAYENFGEEAAKVAKENPDDIVYTFTKFKNAANTAEKYPSAEAYANLVDLRNLAENVKQSFPELKEAGNELVKAIDKAVVYNKRGDVLNRGGGLSSYYPTSLLDEGKYIRFYKTLADQNLATQSPVELYSYLYNNMKGQHLDLSGLADTPIEVDEEKKTVSVELTEDELKQVESVRCQLILLRFLPDGSGNEELNALFLGGDSSMKENRRIGKFESAFRGKWVTLDGTPLYVQVVSDSTRKNKQGKKVGGTELCLANIMLNGQAYKMFISRTYPGEKLTIIGVAPNVDQKVTLPSGDLESLKKGDVVVPIYYLATSDKIEKEFNGKSPENMTDKEK
ncbi:MAG: hypothetical protein IKN27_11185, partial [Selenomonadaceae bacterium]|nr:hypothetical protein [Selenomonadaceae bacterium]